MNRAQRITRILTTRLGERVGMPTYGSELYKLRDRQFNQETRLLFAKYSKEAIEKWEDVKVSKAELTSLDAVNGKFGFTITLSNGDTITGVA
ncbi:GPW/gp25 family protein [Sulfuricurvum sp.]|uniref:GPW/gp25 family protein n=1 Tax=Sulfuricurvum sp. TaxID=2025608 RepID=UPI002612D863|nr:GPW/gp25 family protein [Sulfuricurvum sp.]MDD2267018.1 GPW/gp25 family protein [Sulfuricurvum sp.]MDD2782634.1 GPW/gp25 family protein [Sulfuricurvum sp.]